MKNTGLDIFSLTSEDYYTIFENMQEGITVYRIVYDRNGNVVDLIIKYANPASSTSRVFINKNFRGKSITKLYGSNAVSSLIMEVNEIVSTGKIKKYETYSPTIDSYFSFSAFSPAKNLYVTLTTDITEQKKAEQYLRNAHDELEIKVQERTSELLATLQEKELLLREIHHRVKNNLQIISSLLNLQIPYIKDEQSIEFFKESQNRVKSISMVHEKLYQSKNLDKIDFGSYISNIVTNLFQTYDVNQNIIEYNLSLDNVELNIETSIPCGLIITELITNSIKHAFPAAESHGSSSGKIEVKLYPENEKFTLVIKDNGIGIPKDLNFKNTKSLGLQLVNLLINQVDGFIKLNREKGTEFRIEFEELKYRERI
ncbi:histidine kinase dimerization/phosphoacceptor domain -containing protein [Methanobacterium sp.]|uniref:PAS domain-containing sensor histidine kinase n=1 Tax=Methanobacterium sp. TaxID=2164 RepID=UPI003C74707B